MLSACQIVLSETSSPELFAFAERNCKMTKNLYNAALFRIRQVFTGWNKESRTDNETEVFAELELTCQADEKFHYRRVLKYYPLERIMRATENPDFFAGLPMQTAQSVLRMAAGDFENWLKALKEYRKSPDKFLGKPRMPKYCKSQLKTFKVTNQDAVLYPGQVPGTSLLKLPGLKKDKWIPLPNLSPDSKLKEVVFKPYYGKYLMTLVIEDLQVQKDTDMTNLAGLDFGTDNVAAIVCTDGSAVVYKGGAVLSANQLFTKKRAEAVSIITQGHKHMWAKSAHLDHLSLKHDCFVKDQLHRISADIIRFCLDHQVGTLVLGVNKLWKQNCGIGKRNNQKFVGMPHERLRWMIEYKAAAVGIQIIEQEESYTSKADVTAGDLIPVYGEEQGTPLFSGRRIQRGLYRCHNGLEINADCNGAANILRKAIPDAWKNTADFRFLAIPESRGFHDLQPRYRKAA